MTTTNEPSPDSEQEPIDDDESIDNVELSCYLGFQLTEDDDLIFDAAWSHSNNLPKLAKIIYLIQNSDFIMENIKDMETENEEDVEVLAQLIEELNNRPAIYPTEVFNDKQID